MCYFTYVNALVAPSTHQNSNSMFDILVSRIKMNYSLVEGECGDIINLDPLDQFLELGLLKVLIEV
jgi:hypothetical protein